MINCRRIPNGVVVPQRCRTKAMNPTQYHRTLTYKDCFHFICLSSIHQGLTMHERSFASEDERLFVSSGIFTSLKTTSVAVHMITLAASVNPMTITTATNSSTLFARIATARTKVKTNAIFAAMRGRSVFALVVTARRLADEMFV